MGSLSLLIRVPHLREVIPAGARVDILPLDASPRQRPPVPAERAAIARVKHGLMVELRPAESQDAESSPLGTFEPGRYRVRAELPSGEVLEATIELTDDQPAHVTLEAEPSPHDWLAFAQTTGATRVPSLSREADKNLRLKLRSIRRLPFNRPVRTLSHGSLLMGRLGFGWTAPPVPSQGRLACQFLTADASTWTSALSPTPWSSAGSGPWKSRDDSETRLWTRTADEPQGLDALFVDAPDTDWLLVAPRGWRRVTPTGESNSSPIEIALAVSDESPAIQGPSLYVKDHDLAPAMAWMSRGRVDIAADILQRRARELLVEKVVNAYAAALGAYILCDVPSSTFASGTAPAAWLHNLDEWFPWLPDGAIAHALAQLQAADSDEAIDNILLTTVRAYERGIPLYTVGVHRLLDLLLMLQEHVATGRTSIGVPLEAHNARIRSVRTVLGRMRTDRVFTSIRLPNA